MLLKVMVGRRPRCRMDGAQRIAGRHPFKSNQ